MDFTRNSPNSKIQANNITSHNQQGEGELVTNKRSLKIRVNLNSTKNEFKSGIELKKGNKLKEFHQKFTGKPTLKRHKLHQSGERPFKCDVCIKCFSQSSHLNKHKRIHTGNKPFKCDECAKCFLRKAHLKKHKLDHKQTNSFVVEATTRLESVIDIKEEILVEEEEFYMDPSRVTKEELENYI